MTDQSSDQDKCILVTGANSGLGFGTCCRLIDEFLNTRPSSARLTVIFTTRNAKKGQDTLRRLKTHLSAHPTIRPQLPISNPRIFFRPESLELTSVLSVRALCVRILCSAVPRLDALILNAGISGSIGLNWPMAIFTTTVDLVHATTWPTYKIAGVGWITGPQVPRDSQSSPEPPLGEIFAANVLGHYLLAHGLMPLLRACPASQPGRVVWVSSIEPGAKHFNASDVQGLRSRDPYEHSKRMTDLMALTARLSNTVASVDGFMACGPDRRYGEVPRSKPTIHVAHPGICATAIVTIPWVMQLLMTAVFWVVRWIGSPWHVISSYGGSSAMVWLALADAAEIESGERRGPVKWGSAVGRWGGYRVRPTEVEEWGIRGDGESGVIRREGLDGWGRKRRSEEARPEDVETFVEQGQIVWRELEKQRKEWEGRVDDFERAEQNETKKVL